MDEIEQSVFAHEMALIEVAAFIDRAHLVDAMDAIRAGIVESITEEERTIRLQAIQLLDDAMRRYDPPASGLFLHP